VAKVLAIGDLVTNVAAGDHVHVPIGRFTWQQRLIVPAVGLFPLARDADLHQLAMLRVNPPTAALCLSEFVDLKPGDWIIQNGGTSAVGRGVIAFAKARELKTVSIVRRPEAIAEVRAAGSDVVLLAGEGIAGQIAEATGKAQIKLGLDGIGGPSMAMVSGAISPGGTLVVYSAMSLQPGVANQLDIIFRDISIRGFWLAYPRIHKSGAFDRAVRQSAELIAKGVLHVPVAAVYPLEELQEAVAHANQGPKVLLKMN
jgi:NADPH:quinone reductase-like Zn-dependent oxidoreductase